MKKNKRGQILRWLIALAIMLVMGCQNVPVQDVQKQNAMQSESVYETESVDVTEFAEDIEIEQVTETDSEELEVSEVDVFEVEDGTYISKEEVAVYLHLYGELPDNFITKKEANDYFRRVLQIFQGAEMEGESFTVDVK